jgi:hypothetical protein
MVEWQVLTAVMFLSAVLMPWLLVPASLALFSTLVGCVRHAWASKIDDVATPSQRLRFRFMILWMHFVQPWARVRGRIKGYFSDANYTDTGRALLTNAPRLSLGATLRLTFFRLDEKLWDTHYTALDTVLHGLRKQAAGALTPVRCDDGFGDEYDMVLRAGRTYAFRLKIAGEDHGGLNRLLRVRIGLDRPWLPMFVVSAGLGLLTAYLLRARFAVHSWMLPELVIGGLLLLLVLERVSRHGGQVVHALRTVSREHGISLVDNSAAPVVHAPEVEVEADEHRPAMS